MLWLPAYDINTCMKVNLFFSLLLALFVALSIFAQKGKVTEFRSKTDPVIIGEIAPDFTLKDENGKTFSLSAIKQSTVLVFYRGYW